ncbi:CFI-box-CTERM domain-containing protein [Pseudomonas aeruginosa]|uniref:CFI-box-CTERM domain-containing protein n=1 Tax=Pseudomonas aeruginosa TaxID=287 RepID=UPI00128D2176|nr:CFI-box-CTERM domain-containing protein [Pseudomonas aeruginosa]
MSDDKKNLKASSSNRNVELHDNGLKAGSLINQAVSRLSKEQADSLMQKAGEEALRLEAKQHELNIEYVHAKKTVEDHIDAFNMLEKSGRLTTQKVTTDVKSGNSTMRIESKSGAKCFVATAAYQNPYHPDVKYLRAFRDETLSKSKAGRSFIDWYWRTGPRLASFVEDKPVVRSMAKFSIGIIVKAIKLVR